jgi:hypothetical protein
VTGLCYEISSDDASSLRLLGLGIGPARTHFRVWFALR